MKHLRATVGGVLPGLLLLMMSCSNTAPQKPLADGSDKGEITASEVLSGLRSFYAKTARDDGSFQPGIDPHYPGMADCAYSDLAAVTYACTISRTFGWKLPNEEKTAEFLLARQREHGEFFNVAGTVDPRSAEGRTYNTTQGLVALHALGLKPRNNPLPVFEEILKRDYKTLPAFSTSFFPLAYLCYGQAIPAKADRGIRALMVQDETGYTNDHIAATFHASHYYSLIGEATPKAREMVQRILRDQKPDGSWLINMPSRDRHATFDAVFTLLHEGQAREDCRAAITRAAKWALSCRNADGGFGHYPGSTSDADATYFQVGTLVMAGFLKPADPLPKDPQLLSWGHLMPLRKAEKDITRIELGGWVGAVAFNSGGDKLATGTSDGLVQVWDTTSGNLLSTFRGHENAVTSVAFSLGDQLLASASYDQTVKVWNLSDGSLQFTLKGHRGPVMTVKFFTRPAMLATGGVDGTIKLWDSITGQLKRTLKGHTSWVNAIALDPFTNEIYSASSDGTIKIWRPGEEECKKTIEVSKAEIRSLVLSPGAEILAAGLRYGSIKAWKTQDLSELPSINGLAGDVWSLAFTDKQNLVSGSGDWNLPGQVTIWDTQTGKAIQQINHTGEVLSVAACEKNGWIAAGGGDKTVMIVRRDRQRE